MDIPQIKELMTLLEESKLGKLVFKKGDFELHLEKESVPLPAPRVVTVSAESTLEAPPKAERGTAPRADAPGTYVTSPMVGTFYGAPAPDQPPFVKVGDRVDESTVVCIVEAMKVMNEVKAGVSGIVAEILADSSQPVEFGTRLLRIT
jgi:acetyl-CoA carboxylase biotin carboxyl carrier protein